MGIWILIRTGIEVTYASKKGQLITFVGGLAQYCGILSLLASRQAVNMNP